MDGIKEQGAKLLADLRDSINKLVDADARLARTAFALTDATRAVQKMPAGRDKTFALERIAAQRAKLTPHVRRVAALKKTAGALLALLKPFGIGVVQVVLPIVAVAALLVAASLLYKTVVNDTRQATLEADKLRLLSEGKVTARELADAFDKPAGEDWLGDIKKVLIVGAIVLLAPTIIAAVQRRSVGGTE